MMEVKFHLQQLLLLALVFASGCSSLRLLFRPAQYLPRLIDASRQAKSGQSGGWREAGGCKCPAVTKLVEEAAEQANVKSEDVLHAYRKVTWLFLGRPAR